MCIGHWERMGYYLENLNKRNQRYHSWLRIVFKISSQMKMNQLNKNKIDEW